METLGTDRIETVALVEMAFDGIENFGSMKFEETVVWLENFELTLDLSCNLIDFWCIADYLIENC